MSVSQKFPLVKLLHQTLVFVILFTSDLLWGQDIPVSQFSSNPGILNPAFVGTTGGARVNMYYRDQWPQIEAGIRNFSVLYDRSFSEYHSGLGVKLSNELSGFYYKPALHAIYSYQVKLGHDFFASMAFDAGLVQKYISLSGLTFKDPGENLSSGFSKLFPDFGMGIVAFYHQLYGGVAVNHLTEPYQGEVKTAESRLIRSYLLHLGYMYQLQGRLLDQQRVIAPSLLVQVQGAQKYITWNLNGQYDSFLGGIGLRNDFTMQFDALIFFAGIKTKRLRITYSYDMNIGKMVTNSVGAHEISFTMVWETQTKKKHNEIKCPSFLM